ncbi:MAG: dienelactone hydrolase family protein [Anaerolineaceae bacterium]
MCFPFDAVPPIPAIAGAAIDTEDVTLKSADGTQFAAFAARAETPSTVGMVVLPDVRGLFRFYEELAMRFAEVGINSVAIDYFGRTAGVAKRDADFSFMEHVMKTHPDTVSADTRAAVEFLRSAKGGGCTSVFVVGFCFGGSTAWNQAAEGHGLKGVIGFYGHPSRVIQDMFNPGTASGIKGSIDRIAGMECPVMVLQAGADQMIKQADTDAFKAALDAAGIANEVKTYEGAPHSFFDRSFEEHKEASADAWARILAFVEKYR